MKIIYFLLLSLFWGGSFLCISISLEGFSPFLAATLRVAIALILTFIYVLWKRSKFPKRSLVIETIINGAIGIGIPWALLFWGEQFVEPALCAIINATAPIFTVVFAAIIIKSKEDRITWNKTLGILIGLIGIVVIFGPFITTQSAKSSWGLTAIVGMAFCYGISIAWLKRLSEHMGIAMIMFLDLIGALIVLLPISIIYGITDYSLTGESLFEPILAILYLGIFSTAIAFIIFYKLLKVTSSVEAAAVTYMIPIVSIALDFFVLDKWIGSHALFGALIVFAALKLINKPAAPAYID